MTHRQRSHASPAPSGHASRGVRVRKEPHRRKRVLTTLFPLPTCAQTHPNPEVPRIDPRSAYELAAPAAGGKDLHGTKLRSTANRSSRDQEHDQHHRYETNSLM